MEFQIGKILVKLSIKQEILMVVFPVSDHVVSIKTELFRVGGSNSVNISIDAYKNDDGLATEKVERELRDMGL